jgi:hypothetical protein
VSTPINVTEVYLLASCVLAGLFLSALLLVKSSELRDVYPEVSRSMIAPNEGSNPMQQNAFEKNNIENIPILPNAGNVSVVADNGRLPYSREISFMTSASSREVLSFYKDSLATLGWKEQRGVISDLSRSSFLWSSDSLAYDIYLSVQITTLTAQQTHVRLGTERKPKPNEVLAFPGATMISTDFHEFASGIKQRLNVYETTSDIPNVEKFYKETLKESGWLLDLLPDAGGSDLPGMYFSYFAGSVENAETFVLAVLVKRTDLGQTGIEVRIRASQLDD